MKNFLLIGLGNFGKHLAKQFYELGHQVMAVDEDEADVDAILPIVTNAQIGDATNEAFLRSLGVDNYDICFVTIGDDFQSSLETVSLLKDLGARFVVARADRDVHAKFLLRNGADEVLYPEKQVARLAAIKYSSEHIIDYFELEDGHGIYEIDVPEDWKGESVIDLDVRKKFKVNIIAVKENGKLNLSITPDTRFLEGQTLLVLGEYKAIERIINL